MNARELIKTGWNWYAMHNGDWSRVEELLAIRRLNSRATGLWTRENNEGSNWSREQHESNEGKQERCWEHAQRIVAARGWTITAPGLWWIVTDEQGNDITPQI